MWPGIFIGGGIVFVGIVIAENVLHYSIGDKVADLFRSAESKVQAAQASAAKFAAKAEALKAKIQK